ncbi:MarR family winged helix-turn-helix transcriptional regulator [Microbacterium sp. KHB019]|uniref:MarR family winged helix-turn-helix transcriptional regulator n=1 Tax=Microbacterium sp. KHB019 TaxID=3129770 RepID=UPI00307973CB
MNRADIVSSIVVSAHALARIAAQDAENDAPAAQWRALTLLEREPDQRVGALARASRTTQPGMTRLLGELERAGLVSRSPDASDSRATVVDITDAGRTALEEWREAFRRTLAPRFADLDAADWDALHRSAEILAAHSIEQHPESGVGE